MVIAGGRIHLLRRLAESARIDCNHDRAALHPRSESIYDGRLAAPVGINDCFRACGLVIGNKQNCRDGYAGFALIDQLLCPVSLSPYSPVAADLRRTCGLLET